ncbi:MAG: cupin domain-containing protein [Opitutaceae bacterium]|jgi:mannose-6-phosphate isomerase-like protein (cupin superfamily)
MNRRQFLKFPLAAAALTLDARAGGGEGPGKAFSVRSQEDRYAEELLVMGGRFYCKVSGRDTGGELCIYDTVRRAKGGPALHLHHSQDEWFYVMRGEFIAKVGDATLSLNPGDSAFAPRMIPHAFAKVGEAEGQLLIAFQPAGSMEDFFRQMAKLGGGIPRNQEVALKELWERHGMEIVGPPLVF